MKKAIDLKVGNKIKVGGEILSIDSIDISEIGKQGKRKVRIQTKRKNGETVVLIRPHDYPINTIDNS